MKKVWLLIAPMFALLFSMVAPAGGFIGAGSSNIAPASEGTGSTTVLASAVDPGSGDMLAVPVSLTKETRYLHRQRTPVLAYEGAGEAIGTGTHRHTWEVGWRASHIA